MGVAGTPAGSSRALRLDPHALPVRYSARDGGADGKIRQVELDRDRVILRRAVCGVSMKLGVRIAEFRGVSLRLLPPEDGEPAASAVVLEHRDPGLSVPLFLAFDGDDVIAVWRSWSRVLGVPLLLMDDDGALREPFARLGRLDVGAMCERRRRRGAVKWRRPSFLARRKPGRVRPVESVHRGEREIIARN